MVLLQHRLKRTKKIFCQQQTLHIEDLHREKPKEPRKTLWGKLKKVSESKNTEHTSTQQQYNTSEIGDPSLPLIRNDDRSQQEIMGNNRNSIQVYIKLGLVFPLVAVNFVQVHINSYNNIPFLKNNAGVMFTQGLAKRLKLTDTDWRIR